MNEMAQFLARHGYWLLFGAMVGRQACLPIPANLILLAAGALARLGRLGLSGTISLSVMTLLLADLAWFVAGRRLGDRVLHLLCGMTRDPGSCVRRGTGAFASHGVRTLLISKFVVGLDAVAVPLAGASGKSVAHFLLCDAAGALFWTATYAFLGYIFRDQLDTVATHVARVGGVVAFAALVAFGGYLLHRLLPMAPVRGPVRTRTDHARATEKNWIEAKT
jgi:membrane protein DedA with SNARE-associated domain